jgi:hypothetical protein
MSHTNVKSEWVDGNLVFKDKSGAEIVTFDGTNRKLSIPSGSAIDNAGTVAFTGTQTFDEIAGNDASLGITGLAATADTGGAVLITGGATTTSGVGGAATLKGGAGSGADIGGAALVTGGRGGATNAVGGAATVTAGAGQGTAAGAVASVVGGASGAGATGNGGNAAVTGGAAASTNGSGGSVVLTPGAKTGSGIAGGNFLRSAGGLHFRQQAAAVEKADGAETVTAAEMINGIVVFTVTTGRTLTTPTGAALLAGCPAAIAAGDSFDFSLITIGTGADDIATLTAGDGDVTFVGRVTVGPALADNTIEGFGTWRFRYMGANAFVGYRIG